MKVRNSIRYLVTHNCITRKDLPLSSSVLAIFFFPHFLFLSRGTWILYASTMPSGGHLSY
jgi:hypothetical protein